MNSGLCRQCRYWARTVQEPKVFISLGLPSSENRFPDLMETLVGAVLFDLVVEVAHVPPHLAQPIVVQTLGAVRVIPQVRVPKTPERMVSSFVRPGVVVPNVVSFNLQRYERENAGV